MKTVHSVYEDGVFKPVEPVNLPEHCRVQFEPIREDQPSTPDATKDLARFCGVLSEMPVDPLEYERQIRR